MDQPIRGRASLTYRRIALYVEITLRHEGEANIA
jgi:hypothetical protein